MKAKKKVTARGDHGYRAHVVWWSGVQSIGLVVQLGLDVKRKQLTPGAGVPIWLSPAQATKIRDGLTRALKANPKRKHKVRR